MLVNMDLKKMYHGMQKNIPGHIFSFAALLWLLRFYERICDIDKNKAYYKE